MWNKVVQRELRPHVEIGDDEVDAAIERIRANAGKEEYLVSEIFLVVDNPKDEDQVKQFAENLVQQLKSGGNFGSIARQFSQGTGAATGGDIGWIQEGQLPPELNGALVSLHPGETAGPIRSASGYHILGLREKRMIAGGDPGEITVDLRQIFRPFDSDTNKMAIVQEANFIHSSVSGCSTLQDQLSKNFPAWRLQDLGTVKLAKIPSWIAAKIRDLPVDKASEPMPTDKGALLFFICEKHVPDSKIERAAILNSIGSEKLELQARRLIRDLRRGAYLDIRLSPES
jgi:peptidyl-prolyl cis-trans isomerase SurA